MFHALEPEVAGGFGDNSILDTSSHPPVVEKLHYELDGWLGDELLELFPCYIVTEKLRGIIEKLEPVGCRFDAVDVTTSDQFREMYPGREVPMFYWLKPTGMPGIDDFGISSNNCLVVSDRVFQAMTSQTQLSHCDVEEFTGKKKG